MKSGAGETSWLIHFVRSSGAPGEFWGSRGRRQGKKVLVYNCFKIEK